MKPPDSNGVTFEVGEVSYDEDFRLVTGFYEVPDAHVIPAGGEVNNDADSVGSASLGSDEQHKGSPTLLTSSGSKLVAFVERAKIKGRKLVATTTGSKREKRDTECESVDEALQCTLQPALGVDPMSSESYDYDDKQTCTRKTSHAIELVYKAGPDLICALARICRMMPFFHYRMTVLAVLVVMLAVFPGFITGLLWGLYIAFMLFLYLFVSDPKPKVVKESLSCDDTRLFADDIDVAMEANNSLEGDALGVAESVVYKGWMNELKSRYSASAYHVNHAQSVLVRLEGTTLRISRPAKAVLKHAFHEDPTLKHSQPTMVAQSIYDLGDAKVTLRPKRLAARRWWSRKYPIHIRFSSKSSALAEVDLTKAGMSRSVSLHPVGSAPDGLPIVSEIRQHSHDYEGYAPETESSDDEHTGRIARSNSAGDLTDFTEKSAGLSRKKQGRSIYLFVRAAREKERWFHLLREACAKGRKSTAPRRNSTVGVAPSQSSLALSKNVDNEPEKIMPTTFANYMKSHPALEYFLYRSNHIQFSKQMFLLIGSALPTPEKGSTVSVDLGTMKWRPGVPEENSDLVESLNTVATRIFFDFCRDSFWVTAVKQKIQSKLATIHLPYFIETLELSELDLGTTAPKIMAVYAPKVDEWGLWVDFEMKYEGGIRLVLQTSVNLLKLQNGAQQVESEKTKNRFTQSVRASRYSDEDLPESPESSPDEDFGAKNEIEINKERKGKKILSIVERAAQSSLFQKAAKLSRVARLMEEVSSTPLMLNVEVGLLEGIMTINIPPPPSDRLWYAFRRVPKVGIRAIPQVGDRSVDLTTVSDWIESKLRLLIEKNLVCPNMDDIILPVMSGNALLRMGYNQ